MSQDIDNIHVLAANEKRYPVRNLPDEADPLETICQGCAGHGDWIMVFDMMQQGIMWDTHIVAMECPRCGRLVAVRYHLQVED